jgi:predicted transcriptional regulator of viral defense system
MSKTAALNSMVETNHGYLRIADAVRRGVSRTYLGEYVRAHGLIRVAHGLYMSENAWSDGMYVIQTRYPKAVFSHETALFLLGLTDREPSHYSLTLVAGSNATTLAREGVKVYKVRAELFEDGVMDATSPAGHAIRAYSAERTLVDIVRSRSNIEIQDYQTAFKEYTRLRSKNLPQLMRLAKAFSVEKMIRQYMEVLL